MRYNPLWTFVLIVLTKACEYTPSNDEVKCFSTQFEKGKPLTLQRYGTKLDLSLIKGPIYKETFTNFVKTKELIIRSSGITKVEEGFLQHLENLELLTIKINHGFPNITKKMLMNCCQKVRVLKIYDNNFKFIEKGALTIMKNLEEIWIEKQRVGYITENYFMGLTKLKKLSLQSCSIKDVHSKSLKTLENLIRLEFPGNQIKRLRDGLLSNLGKLEILQLQHNEMRNISGNEFKGLTSLQRLNLDGNKITRFNFTNALSHMPNLKVIIMKFSSLGCEKTKLAAELLKKNNIEVKGVDESIRQQCKSK